VRAAVVETTALGAAFLAGLGVGLWSGTDELARTWRSDRTFDPQMPEGQREAFYSRWKRALERAKGWAQH
jgi:glycerol kinase